MCVQQLGRRGGPKGGSDDVTERQAHGSQPVRVRPGETPGSPVAALPASGETPGSRRRKTAPVRGGQPTGPQHEAKPAASLRITAQAAKREPSLHSSGEGHGRHLRAWSGCQGTLRRRGRGTVGRVSWELERPSVAPSLRGSGSSACLEPATTGKWRAATRESEGVVGPPDGLGQHNPTGGKGPCFIGAHAGGRGSVSARMRARSTAKADGLDPSRALQRVLYRSAKQPPHRRFHALFDKVARGDILERAWEEVRSNRGAPGVDGVAIDQVEASGVASFLQELAALLTAGSYRPAPLRRVHIPKPGQPGTTRPLGIPTVAA